MRSSSRSHSTPIHQTIEYLSISIFRNSAKYILATSNKPLHIPANLCWISSRVVLITSSIASTYVNSSHPPIAPYSRNKSFPAPQLTMPPGRRAGSGRRSKWVLSEIYDYFETWFECRKTTIFVAHNANTRIRNSKLSSPTEDYGSASPTLVKPTPTFKPPHSRCNFTLSWLTLHPQPLPWPSHRNARRHSHHV